MRVERFSLFFGPMLVKFKRGETEYGIGPIPLGGYVKISGMNPAEELPAGRRAPRLLPPGRLEAGRRDRGGTGDEHPRRLRPAGRRLLAERPAPAARPREDRIGPAGDARRGVLQKGDVLTAVDGKPVRLEGETLSFISQIASHRCAGLADNGLQGGDTGPVHRPARLPRGPAAIYPRYDAKLKRMLVGISSGRS
jgi:regulator of sigma E protease